TQLEHPTDEKRHPPTDVLRCELGPARIRLGENLMEVATVGSAATVRRSDRVCLTLLLEASGRDAEGHEFAEPARTMLISRHGGVIVVHRALAAGQQVHLRRT